MSIVDAHKQSMEVNSTIVTGNDNLVNGDNNTVYGDWNTVVGNNNTIYGNNNRYVGCNNSVTGSNNTALTGNVNAILLSIPIVGSSPYHLPDPEARSNHINESLDQHSGSNDPPQIPRTVPLELRAIRDNMQSTDLSNFCVYDCSSDPPQVTQKRYGGNMI